MAQLTHRGLPEFGLPLVGSEDPSFGELVSQMESCPQPFFNWTDEDLQCAAILRNGSGKAIIVLAHIWRYTSFDGQTHKGMNSNLGSNTQIDFLRGKTPVVRDLNSFILPGSLRLITENGTFGNNLDVLPDFEFRGGGGGFCGRRGFSNGEMASIELVLDFALLEDGLCVGPDESQLLDSITEGLERQRLLIREMLKASQSGASAGQLFELLLPLARHVTGPPGPGKRTHSTAAMFANASIHRLINLDHAQLLHWLEGEAVESPIPLHRPPITRSGERP